MRPRLARRSIAAAFAALVVAPIASAQFTQPTASPVRERISGVASSGVGAPTPEGGDQFAAFAGQEIIGVYTFGDDQENPLSFRILLNGDNPDTPDVDEGADIGQPVTFRFYDSSTNITYQSVTVLNPQGQASNLTFQGDFVIAIPGLPLDLTPTREFNLRINDGGTGGGGGDGGDPAGQYDVNGDGRVDKDDAAVVLRLVVGAGRAVPDEMAARADVNGDGMVSTQDAIEILRNR